MLDGLMKKILWRKVRKKFKETTGDELPIDMEQLQEIFKYLQKAHARDVIVYNLTTQMAIRTLGIEHATEIMKHSATQSTEELDIVRSTGENLVLTLAIVQGLNKAEDAVDDAAEEKSDISDALLNHVKVNDIG